MVCITEPPSKRRAAPTARLARPEETAATCSARSPGMLVLDAMRRPSADTRIACAASGTSSTKRDITQSRSRSSPAVALAAAAEDSYVMRGLLPCAVRNFGLLVGRGRLPRCVPGADDEWPRGHASWLPWAG